MVTISDLLRAKSEARARTGDTHIGVQVCAGRFDVVRAIPPVGGRGHYTIDYQRADLSLAQAIEFLNAYKTRA